MAFPILVVVAFATITFVSAAAQEQTTWLVDDDNCPGPGTGTQADPFCMIQDGIDAAESGDLILIEPGVYAGGFDLQSKDLWIESLEGPQVTVLDAASQPGVRIGPHGVLVGFTVTNARASFGAGMAILGFETIVRGNIFEGNEQTSGGAGAAIFGNGASPIIEGNIFRDNICDNQFLSGVVSFVNSSSPVIINNIFEGNDCRGVNMTLPAGNSPKIINNTFVGNRVAIRFDCRVSVVAQSYQNNIVLDNEIGLEVDFGCDENMLTWGYNLVFANAVDYDGISDQTGRNGNISVDPLFLDPATNDFHLKENSPAIDAADNKAVPADIADVDNDGDTTERTPFDLDGNPRFIDDPATADTGNGTPPIVDMGAYEFQCGNGVVDPGEECDDGPNNSNTEPDACRTDCRQASCGDGVVDPGEECDDGATNSDTALEACRTTCMLPSCGDGVVDTGEECDDGNTESGDGCDATCQIEPEVIPTVSEWGLVVMTLLLLTGLKIKFGGRQPARV